MRHLKSGRKLGRTKSHRRATLSALSVALISHKKIRTTVAKAKEARMVVEKLVTKAKRAITNEGEGAPKNVHARRQAFSFLRDRKAVSTLFDEIAPKVAGRAGGYTRVVKLGQRRGDGAPLALIEFVDYNIAQAKSAKSAKSTRKATKAAPKKKQTKKTAATAAESAPPTPEVSPEIQESQSAKTEATESETKKD